MKKTERTPLVLLDVDETIIDTSYNTTDDGLVATVEGAITKGWQVGLHSDTPIARLAQQAATWHMNGPLVGELGNIIVPNHDDLVPMWEDEELRAAFEAIRPPFLARGQAQHPGIKFEVGNSRVARDALFRQEHFADERWALVDSLRQYSLSFYCLTVGPDHRGFDGETLASLAGIGAHLFDQILGENPKIDLNPQYGICIIHGPRAKKHRALPALKAHYGPIVMIGNSMSDFLNDPDVIQCAVGNASDELKQRSAFVASSPLTTGAIEALNWAINNVR